MDNSNKQGIVYNTDGEIVGYNINSSIFIPLSNSELEEALYNKAIQKLILGGINTCKGYKLSTIIVDDWFNPQNNQQFRFRDMFDIENSFKEDQNGNN